MKKLVAGPRKAHDRSVSHIDTIACQRACDRLNREMHGEIDRFTIAYLVQRWSLYTAVSIRWSIVRITNH